MCYSTVNVFVVLCLQQDLAALSAQVDKTTTMYKTLLHEYPDAGEHMTVKQDEMMTEWNSLLAKAGTRTERLQEAESVQLYFDDYRGLWYVWVCIAAFIYSFGRSFVHIHSFVVIHSFIFVQSFI